MTAPQEGWYTDPSNTTHERFWTGTEWTDQIRPKNQVTAPSVMPMEVAAVTPAATKGTELPLIGKVGPLVIMQLLGTAFVLLMAAFMFFGTFGNWVVAADAFGFSNASARGITSWEGIVTALAAVGLGAGMILGLLKAPLYGIAALANIVGFGVMAELFGRIEQVQADAGGLVAVQAGGGLAVSLFGSILAGLAGCVVMVFGFIRMAGDRS